MKHRITGFLAHIGVAPVPDVVDRLVSYGEWLLREAQPAGGIGPGEHERLVDRHLLDSLAFAAVWHTEPTHVLDVGTGVGLPGIPLAIAHPTVRFRLLDRSGRRIGLLRRAIRVLDVENAHAEQGEMEATSAIGHVVVSRASLPPRQLFDLVQNTADDLVIAASRGKPVHEAGMESVVVEHEMLDRPAWFLRMSRS